MNNVVPSSALTRGGLVRGHPARAALLGMVPMLALAALPAQIDWADRIDLPELFADRLRFLAVSPTLLYSERSGWPAYLTELVWAVLFLTLLFAAAWRLAVAVADDWTRPVAVALALPVLAPSANLVALAVVRAVDLTTDAEGRTELLIQLISDAQSASGHVMVVALTGSVVLLLSHPDRLWARDADGALHVTTESALTILRGPMSTLWRRIGMALLAAVLAYPAMYVVGDVLAIGFEPLARVWCAGRTGADACVIRLTGLAGTEPPHLSYLLLDPARRHLVRIYSAQAFLLVFAVAYFQVHTQPLRARALTTLLAVWYAYTLAVVTREGVIDAALGVADEPGLPGVIGLLLPPDGLAHALLAAPAVAVAFAGGHALATRLRRGRRRQPSQPGVTSPAS